MDKCRKVLRIFILVKLTFLMVMTLMLLVYNVLNHNTFYATVNFILTYIEIYLYDYLLTKN